MLVDRPGAEIAAAWHEDAGLLEPAQQRAEQIIGAADAADFVMRRFPGLMVQWIDKQRSLLIASDLGAETFADLEHDIDIGDIRHVFDLAGAIQKHRSRNNPQSGIF